MTASSAPAWPVVSSAGAERPGALDPAGEQQPRPNSAAAVPSPERRVRRLVVASRSGRLANRLAIFANLLAFAEEHGHRVINCTFHSYAHLFEGPSRDIYCRYPLPTRKSLWDRLPGAPEVIRKTRIFYRLTRMASVLNEKIRLLPGVITLREIPGRGFTDLEGPEIRAGMAGARTVFFYGWNFRAPRCVERHAEKVRGYFRPVAPYWERSQEPTRRLRQSADVIVGVHIRHGDYRDWKGGKYFYPAARYTTWMKELSGQFPGRKVAFLVCSNEPRSAVEFPGLEVAITAASPVEDLYALSHCDYILGPVSSFSQWASFVGNKPLLHLAGADMPVSLDAFKASFLKEIPT